MDASLQHDAALVKRLEAIANLNRVLILRAIRVPRALREIEVRDEGTGPPLARQTVRRHLDMLIATDLARAHDGARVYGETTEFVLNHQRLYSLSEELRALARLRPIREPEGETQAFRKSVSPVQGGPALILVNGLEEGMRYEVAPTPRKSEWLIGRKRGADVPLDFDASASAENALVRWLGDGHYLEDLPGSRNGTHLNFARLAEGEVRKLSHGDIVGVGRCLLVYWR
ncbi:MAG TPA: FHA domain-containing protein [Candidatus Thermoplasmatota archaeon]|nr:FHA domain-containing protein [Candidatus Thermoplasmatota archaeon]